VENRAAFLFTPGAVHHTIYFKRNLGFGLVKRRASGAREIVCCALAGNVEMKDRKGKDPEAALSPVARRVLDHVLHAQANDPAVRRALPRSRREAARRIELAQAEISAMRDFMAEQGG
jgi:hypothetical protein